MAPHKTAGAQAGIWCWAPAGGWPGGRRSCCCQHYLPARGARGGEREGKAGKGGEWGHHWQKCVQGKLVWQWEKGWHAAPLHSLAVGGQEGGIGCETPAPHKEVPERGKGLPDGQEKWSCFLGVLGAKAVLLDARRRRRRGCSSASSAACSALHHGAQHNRVEGHGGRRIAGLTPAGAASLVAAAVRALAAAAAALVVVLQLVGVDAVPLAVPAAVVLAVLLLVACASAGTVSLAAVALGPRGRGGEGAAAGGARERDGHA